MCKQFDVLKLKKMYGKEHIGIVRSTFVISPDGDILKQWDKVKVDGHAEEVLRLCKGAMNSNVDHEEVNKFAALAARWWDRDSEFKPLHDINPLRLNYIKEQCGGS